MMTHLYFYWAGQSPDTIAGFWSGKKGIVEKRRKGEWGKGRIRRERRGTRSPNLAQG